MKVLLNCMTPFFVETPSLGLSALKSHLRENGVESEIIYWNVLVHEALALDRTPLDTTLAPFLMFLADEAGDETARRRLLSYVQSARPAYKFVDRGDYQDLIRGWQDKIREVFLRTLAPVTWPDVALFGISANHYQLYPGLVLASYAKQCHPQLKVVVGGLDDPRAARAVMDLSEHIDFAVWGEGEHPLLGLYEHLTTERRGVEAVPQLVYRTGAGIAATDVRPVQVVDLAHADPSRFDDYFAAARAANISSALLPVEGSRCCFWRKCRFCNMNKGSQYRRKPHETLLEEMQALVERYGVYRFQFTDQSANDGSDVFEDLLGGLVELNRSTGHKLKITAEMTPLKMNRTVLRLMAEAGFARVQVGFEGFSDAAMAKFNKAQRFADNLMFLKWSLHYKIIVLTPNIITGYPDEAEEDILAAESNLHYLRFYLDKATCWPKPVKFRLGRYAPYYHKVRDPERYADSPVDYYLPKDFIRPENKLALLVYATTSPHQTLWDHMAGILNYYLDNRSEYKLWREEGALHFVEYLNGQEVKSVVLDGPEYGPILGVLNDDVHSLESLQVRLAEQGTPVPPDRLRACLSVLRANYIVYADDRMEAMMSVIDSDGLASA